MKSLTNHLWVFSDGGDLENTTKRGAPGPTEPRVQEGLWGGGSGCVVCVSSHLKLTNRMLLHMFSHFLFISKEGKKPVRGGKKYISL